MVIAYRDAANTRFTAMRRRARDGSRARRCCGRAMTRDACRRCGGAAASCSRLTACWWMRRARETAWQKVVRRPPSPNPGHQLAGARKAAALTERWPSARRGTPHQISLPRTNRHAAQGAEAVGELERSRRAQTAPDAAQQV